MHAIDHEGRRVLLAKEYEVIMLACSCSWSGLLHGWCVLPLISQGAQGKLIRGQLDITPHFNAYLFFALFFFTGAWYSGSEDYYKVFPYGQGPAYFYDCFQAVSAGEGQSVYRPPVVDSKINVNDSSSQG